MRLEILYINIRANTRRGQMPQTESQHVTVVLIGAEARTYQSTHDSVAIERSL